MDIFQLPELKQLLHQVLENKHTFYQVSNISTKEQKYAYNQYVMVTLIDFFIKYDLIIPSDDFLLEAVSDIKRKVFSTTSLQEIVIYLHELLGKHVCYQLGLENDTSTENKKQILRYIYENYIVNGYFFYSFPSSIKEQLQEKGIHPSYLQPPIMDMKKIDYIFSNHQYQDFIPDESLENKSYIPLTDSPALSYYAAISCPSYLAMLSSSSKYYQKKGYYQDAYYLKDKELCFENLEKICDHIHCSPREKQQVLAAFQRQWDMADASNLTPCIAMIKRSSLKKNHLKEIDEIYTLSEKEALSISIARIIDSRYSVIRCYQLISNQDFTIATLPDYVSIKKKEKKVKLIVPKQSIKIVEEEQEELLPYRFSFSYGYASIVALFGLLNISLGMTLLILLQYFGR